MAAFTAGQRVLASQLNLSYALLATPISTATNGTVTSGTTETLDAVLSTYQFTAVNGWRYEARMNGLILSGSVNGDLFAVRIRDSGSASAPTASSTLVAETVWHCVTGAVSGRLQVPLSGTFLASSSGTHTLGMFAVRLSGTGTVTPISQSSDSGSLSRELYVMSVGPV